MANFDFAKLDAWVQKTNKDIEKVTRGVLLQMSRDIILMTPVGEPSLWQSPPPKGYIGGTARGNWQASVNQPKTRPIKRVDDSGGATISAAQKAIDQAFGNVYYLTNNVPYIRRLEYEGWSTQAPSGMLRVTVARFNQTLEEELRKLK